MSHEDVVFDFTRCDPPSSNLLDRYCEGLFCREATRCQYHHNINGEPAAMWIRDRMDSAHCDEFMGVEC